MRAFLQFADDVGEVGNGSLCRLQFIHSLDRIPQLALFLEVDPITLFIALDEYANETEQELQILFGLRARKRFDGEVARLQTDIQVRAAKDRSERLEALADVEDKRQGRILLGTLQDEVSEIGFA
ncbi:MAG: hypothetical protein ABSF70_12255 [Terracidiphilus sp.]|jgi:hypothetical protein